jgi:hypothetical protein
MYKCTCGKEFKKMRGYQVHCARSTCVYDKSLNTKQKPKKTKANPADTSYLRVSVPCALGETRFSVDVDLSIAATSVRAI